MNVLDDALGSLDGKVEGMGETSKLWLAAVPFDSILIPVLLGFRSCLSPFPLLFLYLAGHLPYDKAGRRDAQIHGASWWLRIAREI